ncbi:MAG: aminodeoxychorismate synthase component I [Acidimicrobiales bacterium]
MTLDASPPSPDTSSPDAGHWSTVRRQLDCDWSPTEVCLALRDEVGLVALTGRWLGSTAVIGSDPVVTHRAADGSDPFALLDGPCPVNVPDPQGPSVGVFGGWAGYLGYQAGGLVERLPSSPRRPHPLPVWHLAWYDHVLHCDAAGTWWFEALVGPGSRHRVAAREQHLRALLVGEPPTPRPTACSPFVAHPTSDDHKKAIRRTLDHIAAGDIYQANVCMRLSSVLQGEAVDLFGRGAAALDPPSAAFVDLGAGDAVVSLSPEQFLRRVGDRVTTRPIKGTRKASGPPETDAARHQLAGSTKDRAENVMIVDLMRNDLGRVCRPGTVEVPRLFDVERHPGLWHLVSEVTGRLAPGLGDGAVLAATFPPGSVTGAPKIRAMEVIAEVEATGREVYTGSIGWVSPTVGAEWNVAIRTVEVAAGEAWLGVGGGIVADSDPDAELRECHTKAAPILRAIGARLAD